MRIPLFLGVAALIVLGAMTWLSVDPAAEIKARRTSTPKAADKVEVAMGSSPANRTVFTAVNPLQRLASVVRGPGELRSRYVRTDLEFLTKANSVAHNGNRGVAVPLNLFDDLKLNFYVERTEHREPGVFVTTGRTDTPLSLVVFANVNGSVVGTLIDPLHGQFTLEPTAEAGIYRVYEADPAMLKCGVSSASPLIPPEMAKEKGVAAHRPLAVDSALPAPNLGKAVGSGASGSIAAFAGDAPQDFWPGLNIPTSGTRIPLLALYNAEMAAKAVALFGSLDGLRARIEAGIALTNAIMLRARATACVELVGMAQITLTEPAAPTTEGIFDTMAQAPEYNDLQLRYQPALTTYISAKETATDGIGWAHMPGRRNLVLYGYLNSTVMTHEIGHNFGLGHNVEDAKAGANVEQPYAHGWRLATSPAVSDVMALGFSHVSTLRLPLYSDPTASFLGAPLGDALQADNARAARENTAKAAAQAAYQFGAVGDNWIANLSTRGFIGEGDQVLIAGLIVSGTGPKQVALRGIGPSLRQAGIQQALSDPRIQLYGSTGLIRENDNWQSDARVADLRAVNLAPSDPSESALLITLDPGAYTVILSGMNAITGVGLVEAFEMDPSLNRFSYWNSNQVSRSATSNVIKSPLEYVYDFGGVDRDLPVLFQLNNVQPGKFMIVARRDPSSPYPVDPFLQIVRYPKGQNPYIFGGATVVTANDNWQSSPAAASLSVSGVNGLADPHTAVVIADTTPDAAYWLMAVPGNPNLAPFLTAGIIDVALYNLTGTAATGQKNRLVNVSTRGVFSSGERVMITGLIIGGTSSRTLGVRALGPALTASGIPNAVLNPKFTIFDSTGKSIFVNDDWQKDPNALMLQKWGLAPAHANEAGLVLTLQPGAYTIVAENNGPDGVGLMEVYELR